MREHGGAGQEIARGCSRYLHKRPRITHVIYQLVLIYICQACHFSAADVCGEFQAGACVFRPQNSDSSFPLVKLIRNSDILISIYVHSKVNNIFTSFRWEFLHTNLKV